MIVGQPLTTPRSAADLLMRVLADEASEVFATVLLSTRRRVLAYHEVSRGTLDSTLVHPREVFKAAYLANAAALVLAHVHPSGVMHTLELCGQFAGRPAVILGST